jgi:hypothetical protein
MRSNPQGFNRKRSDPSAKVSFTLRSAAFPEHAGSPFLERAIVFMAALAVISRAAVVSLAMAGPAAHATEPEQPHPVSAEAHPIASEPHPVQPAKPVCLGASETREEVKAHRLLEPFAALKSAAHERKADALSAKLCHTGDDFLYEITLLQRDGRLVHIQVDAATGKLISHGAHERDAHEQPVKP